MVNFIKTVRKTHILTVDKTSSWCTAVLDKHLLHTGLHDGENKDGGHHQRLRVCQQPDGVDGTDHDKLTIELHEAHLPCANINNNTNAHAADRLV